jgi:PadR family transcriptional regulator, regulatory protein PadR
MKDKDAVLDNLIQELKRGTLSLAVLLSTDKPAYGYTLAAALKERGIDIEQNTLYPLLRRMESQGLLESSWDTGEARPRRYYLIGAAGKDIRARLMEAWKAADAALRAMEETA